MKNVDYIKYCSVWKLNMGGKMIDIQMIGMNETEKIRLFYHNQDQLTTEEYEP